MNYKETFAQRLIELREQKNITQQELAEELGITRQSLSLYEKAERTINIELLAKIADFFNVSTDYLMGRTDTATLDESIQTACKITGLTASSIHNLQNLKNFEDIKVFDIMDAFITSISSSLLYEIREMLISKQKKEIFEIETIRLYCKKHNLPFSEKEIEERGKFIFKKLSNFGMELKKWELEYEKYVEFFIDRCRIVDDDFIFEDLDYKRFIISNEIMRLIDDELEMYLDDTIFTEDFFKKNSEDFRRFLNDMEQDE